MYINVSVVEVGKYSKDVEPKAYCGASGRCYMVYVYDYGAQLTVSCICRFLPREENRRKTL